MNTNNVSQLVKVAASLAEMVAPKVREHNAMLEAKRSQAQASTPGLAAAPAKSTPPKTKEKKIVASPGVDKDPTKPGVQPAKATKSKSVKQLSKAKPKLTKKASLTETALDIARQYRDNHDQLGKLSDKADLAYLEELEANYQRPVEEDWKFPKYRAVMDEMDGLVDNSIRLSKDYIRKSTVGNLGPFKSEDELAKHVIYRKDDTTAHADANPILRALGATAVLPTILGSWLAGKEAYRTRSMKHFGRNALLAGAITSPFGLMAGIPNYINTKKQKELSQKNQVVNPMVQELKDAGVNPIHLMFSASR